MQVSGSSTNSMTLLQQMFATLQTDLSSITGQFATDALSSSANTTGSTSAASGSTTAATTASSASSTPSNQFAGDTLSALIQQQTQPTSWASNTANSIISADGSNGEISLAQVTSALGSSGSSSTTAQITNAFDKMDTNGDGELSASELTAALQQMQQSQAQGGGHHHHHHMSAPSSSSSTSSSTSDTDSATTGTTDALGVSSATSTASIASGASSLGTTTA